MDIQLIIGLVLLVIFLTVVSICVPLTIKHERISYNKGTCPCCGNQLEHVDTDSQGGRLWMCMKHGCWYKTWVSYHCVDNK